MKSDIGNLYSQPVILTIIIPVHANMPRNNPRPTIVQYEPKQRHYGKINLTDSMEAIDMGPMACECPLLHI